MRNLKPADILAFIFSLPLSLFGIVLLSVVAYISWRIQPSGSLGGGLYFYFSFPDRLELIATDGQIWRLFTPVFMHFTWWHIVGNLLTFYYLSHLWLQRLSVGQLWGLILVGGVVSNVAQYFWAGSSFGGLSGVLFAMVGYLVGANTFTRLRFGQVEPPFEMPPTLVGLVMIMLVFGFAGWLGPMANMAHLGGLVCGLLASGWTVMRLK